MTDDDARINRGASWAGFDSRNLRPALTDMDDPSQTYKTLGFRTFRHCHQSLDQSSDQQQPRS